MSEPRENRDSNTADTGVRPDLPEHEKISQPYSGCTQVFDYFTALMESLPDSVYFKDLMSRFTTINRAQARKFGLSDPRDAIGKTDFDFFREVHAREARADEVSVVESGKPIINKEEREIMPDGTELWVSTTKMALFNGEGKVLGTFGVSRDITDRRRSENELRANREELERHKHHLEELIRERTDELLQTNARLKAELLARKRAQEALRESEERYRMLLATSPTYIYSVKIEAGVPSATEHGPGCMAVTGYAAADYKANPNLWFSMVHPDDRQKVLQFVSSDIKVARVPPFEHRIIHADGSVRWVRNTIVHHYSDAGVLVSYDGLVEDITERKKAEDSLRESERLRSVGELARGVAGNFGDILSVIGGHAASISDNLLPGTRSHGDAAEILNAVRHATELMRGLLRLANLCDAESTAKVEAVPLHDVVGQTCELLCSAMAERGISIQVPNRGVDRHVLAVEGQLFDTVISLVGAAAEGLTRGDSIALVLSERRLVKPVPKWGRNAMPGKYIVLRAISQKGAKPNGDATFTPLLSGNGTHPHQGLGHTIAANVVAGWGGWIQSFAKKDGRKVFRLFLSKCERIDSGIARVQKDEVVNLAGRTVLFVDDNAAEVAFGSNALKEAGCEVLGATNAAEGWSLFDSNSGAVSVTVLDMVMRGSDSRDLLERILKVDPTASVVVTSGFPRDYARHHMNIGAWIFLQKPYETAQLAEAVKQAIKRGSKLRVGATGA